MEPAQLGTFSPASVNDIEPNPCYNHAVPSTEPVHFSLQNEWQQYHDCVATFHVFLCLPVFLLPTEEETHKSIALINQYHQERPDIA